MQTCSAERQTHTMPARRPPALPPSPASDKNPVFHKGTVRFGAGAGIRKGLWATGRRTCSYPPAAPDRGSTPGTCPAVKPVARIGSLSPAAYLQSRSIAQLCLPALPGKTFPLLPLISKHRAPAPSGTCWPTESKSPLPFPQNRGGLMLTDAGVDEPALPAARGTKRATLGNYNRPQTSPAQSSFCSASQHLQNQFGTARAGERPKCYGWQFVPSWEQPQATCLRGPPLQSDPDRACGTKVLLSARHATQSKRNIAQPARCASRSPPAPEPGCAPSAGGTKRVCCSGTSLPGSRPRASASRGTQEQSRSPDCHFSPLHKPFRTSSHRDSRRTTWDK
ncbi:uncharacterized protein LOC135992341 [Caloenas nicobarica]|uniref:uncharacterized protein LOC135992341 n=1 Tax=Caloenas nicobarica TaxID=187106 RepID=UPI0032B84107